MIPTSTIKDWMTITCGCGKPARYIADDGQMACNKYFRCLPTVAAALTEALAAIAAIPTSDYSTDGDAAELVRRDAAADIVRAATRKLGITECNNQ